jgi:hypothetical protein
MPKYLFEIKEINSIIQSHSSLSNIDISIVMFEEEDRPPQFYFTSKHLDDLEDTKEIWAKGLYLLSLYKGAYHIYNYDPHSKNDFQNYLSLSRLYPWDSNLNITPTNPHLISQEDPFTEEKINTPLLPHEFPESDFIVDSIYKSRRERKIRNLLLQFGNGIDWINLYAILDSLKTYCSGGKFSKILVESNIPEAQVGNFTGMANNFGLLGVESRHGDKNFDPPKKRMDLNTARALIIDITRKYLEIEFGVGLAKS